MQVLSRFPITKCETEAVMKRFGVSALLVRLAPYNASGARVGRRGPYV